MDIQQKLTSFAMMGATWVMWLLIGLSVLGLAIAIERALVVFSTRDDIRRLRDDLVASLRKGDVPGARARLDRSKSYEARIARAGLSEYDTDPDAAADFLGEARALLAGWRDAAPAEQVTYAVR